MLIICFTKVLTGARKRKPMTDVRIPITSAILQKLLASLQHTISNLYEKILFRAIYSQASNVFLTIFYFAIHHIHG